MIKPKSTKFCKKESKKTIFLKFQQAFFLKKPKKNISILKEQKLEFLNLLQTKFRKIGQKIDF